MKLIGIVGTNSTRSTNRRLLQFIQAILVTKRNRTLRNQ